MIDVQAWIEITETLVRIRTQSRNGRVALRA